MEPLRYTEEEGPPQTLLPQTETYACARSHARMESFCWLRSQRVLCRRRVQHLSPNPTTHKSHPSREACCQRRRECLNDPYARVSVALHRLTLLAFETRTCAHTYTHRTVLTRTHHHCHLRSGVTTLARDPRKNETRPNRDSGLKLTLHDL